MPRRTHSSCLYQSPQLRIKYAKSVLLDNPPRPEGGRFLPDSESPSVGSCCWPHSSRAHLTGDPGLAGPCVLHKLGVPMQELGYRSHKDSIAQCIRSLHPAMKDGAFREKPVIVGSGPNDSCIHCGSTPANPVKNRHPGDGLDWGDIRCIGTKSGCVRMLTGLTPSVVNLRPVSGPSFANVYNVDGLRFQSRPSWPCLV